MQESLQNWLLSSQLWLKALHIISVISWMAALLYLPRLFVYHCKVAPGSEASELLKVMERRLERYIMTPAMLASLLFGVGLLLTPGVWARGGSSLMFKLVLAALLIGVHLMLVAWRKAFARDANRHPERFYRIINEVPTLLMIGIVILIVVRPY